MARFRRQFLGRGACAPRLVLAVVAVSAAGALASSATAVGAPAAILYARSGALWTINPDATGARMLLPSPRSGEIFSAQWSPDRTRITFDRVLRHSQIWTMRADGTHLRQLTSRGDNSEPGWSPDGRWIVYSHARNFRSESDLYRVHPWGGRPRRITRTRRRSEFEPRLSPNGRWLVYQGSARHGSGLWISRPDGRHARLIVPPRFQPAGAEWRPDSHRIIFFTNFVRPHSVLMTVALNGRGRHALTSGPRRQNDNEPSYSPDGRQVVFMRFTRPRHGPMTLPDLWILTVRSHKLRRLTQSPHAIEQTPAWASG